jgi:hypothetical protein
MAPLCGTLTAVSAGPQRQARRSSSAVLGSPSARWQEGPEIWILQLPQVPFPPQGALGSEKPFRRSDESRLSSSDASMTVVCSPARTVSRWKRPGLYSFAKSNPSVIAVMLLAHI